MVTGMLLPTVPAHLRLPSLTKFALKPLSLITLFPRKLLLWLRSLVLLYRLSWLLSILLLPQLLFALSLSQLYCRHHLRRFHYCPLVLSLSDLIVDFFLLYCWHPRLWSQSLLKPSLTLGQATTDAWYPTRYWFSLRASLSSLPHYKIEPIRHTELE